LADWGNHLFGFGKENLIAPQKVYSSVFERKARDLRKGGKRKGERQLFILRGGKGAHEDFSNGDIAYGKRGGRPPKQITG